MNEKNDIKLSAAKQSLMILMIITFIIAGYEFMTATRNFQPGGNIFDFCAHAVDFVPYTMIFILTLVGVLPFTLLLLKTNQIHLTSVIFEKKKLPGDILIGILVGILSAIVTLPFSIMRDKGCTYTIPDQSDQSIWLNIMFVLSLVLVCGFLKELYFRGFAKFFLTAYFGENTAFFLTNLLFSIVDWQNMGSSFVIGLIWSYAYKKRTRLIVPMIAHGMVNLIAMIYRILLGA